MGSETLTDEQLAQVVAEVQGAFAQHANGNAIGPREPNACRWCGEGAIMAEAGGLVWGPGASALRAVVRVVRQNDATATLHDFNDTHSHAEVVALFDRAIAEEESRG